MKEFYSRWCDLTSDPEVLQTVKGMRINLNDELPQSSSFQYPLGPEEEEFVSGEIWRLLDKKSRHEAGKLISPIFIRPKFDGDGFCLILNLKKLNIVSEYVRFKIETMVNVLNLIQPGVFMAKLDIKDAYYTCPIDDQD